MQTAEKTEALKSLTAGYALPASASTWANSARETARTRLEAMGLPGRRDEYWRFTQPEALTRPGAQADVFKTDDAQVFAEIDRISIVFVDGMFREDLSDPLMLEGVEITTLEDALKTDIHWAKELFGVLETGGQNPVPRPLATLNTAYATAGVVIRVTATPSKPISLRYLHEDATSDALIHHVVKLEAGTEFTLLESGPAAARFNKVMEVDIADTATFHHLRAQGRDHERLATTHAFARLGRESHLRSFTLTVNGRLTRNEFVVELTGDDASAHVAGACAGDGDFHHDDTVFVTHDAVNCESRQVYKKVLKNGATGVFQGKILVQPDAQKTDGYQISQGLLLDESSQFLAKPELEIYADDVACSHGSTCGSVDSTHLFYLTSRGIPKHEAEAMLVLAFLDEAVQEIADETLADTIRNRMAQWLNRHST